MVVIEPLCGLSNKLRVVFSFWEDLKTKNERSLTVIWEVSDECPGFFLDYFEPIKGITFLRKNPGLKVDFKHYNRKSEFDHKFVYSDLHLKKPLQEMVNTNLMNLTNNFIAIQVRRTDHTSLAKLHDNFTSDEDFCTFLDENPDTNIFVSADNQESFNFFKQKYSERIKNVFPKNNSNKLRHTSLEDSIVCLYTCVYAKKFKGSGWSSFGQTIEQLRANLH
jgi:hypothetical protein